MKQRNYWIHKATLASTRALAVISALSHPLLFASPQGVTQAEADQSRHHQPLCVKATQRKSYTTDFLKSFAVLQEGRAGWLFRDQDLKTQFGPNDAIYDQLYRLQQQLAQKGTTLVMVPIPTRALIHPDYLGPIDFDSAKAQRAYSQFLTRLRQTGVVVPKLDSLFKKPAQKPLFFARDHHWTHHGARTIARLTANAIRVDEHYGELTSQSFESYLVESEHNHGSLSRAAEKLCDAPFASEPFKVYQTALQSADLFGDEDAVEADNDVVLVGTSNSQGKLRFNFSGFLSHYVKVPVQNMAQSGSGYDGAIRDYLASDLFKQQSPKYLVWEFPSYYTLNDAQFFEGLLAQLGGDS